MTFDLIHQSTSTLDSGSQSFQASDLMRHHCGNYRQNLRGSIHYHCHFHGHSNDQTSDQSVDNHLDRVRPTHSSWGICCHYRFHSDDFPSREYCLEFFQHLTYHFVVAVVAAPVSLGLVLLSAARQNTYLPGRKNLHPSPPQSPSPEFGFDLTQFAAPFRNPSISG